MDLNTVLVILTVLPSLFCEEDLLDQYVQHVGRSNQESSLKLRKKRDADDLVQWTHSEALDKHGKIVLRWQPRHQEILFRVEAETRGYVGIGFSEDGSMEHSDMVIAWVDDYSLKPFILDCHGVPKSQGSAPQRDEVDNYTLMRGLQNDTHTVVEFRRVLDTCDPDDYVLSSDTVRVIWAFSRLDPPHGEFIYHERNRGVQSLHLMGPPPDLRPKNEKVRHWDVTLKNFEVKNNMNTVYWCKIFKAPTLNTKHHIIGYEPVIGAEHADLLHHMIFYECQLDQYENLEIWDKFSEDKGQFCYTGFQPEWEACTTPSTTWAVGSKGEFYPKHLGIPLSNGRSAYYMLEVHFDNLSMKKAIDTSGMRVYYTSELRENEGAVLMVGIAPSTLHFIPPYQKEYKTAGYCSFDCTKQELPKEGVNIVSVVLHSHLAGRQMKVRHIRGGKELQPIVEDKRYNFNYQQSRTLSQGVTVLPGDGLITECTYSTTARSRPTLGGFSTNEEMCVAFLLHYPRTELSWCFSIPPVKYFFEIMGVKEFYGKNMTEITNMVLEGKKSVEKYTPTTKKPLFQYKPGDEMSPEANQRAILALKNAKEYSIEGETSDSSSFFDKLVIKDPIEFRNKTFNDHLLSIPYNETILTKKMEEYFYTGLHLTFCRKRDDSNAVKEKIEKLPNFTEYEGNENNIKCSYKSKRYFASRAFAFKSCLGTVLLLVIACML